MLARHCVEHGPGFWIRFTVHYNLFGGTILAVGTEEQVAELAVYQKKGQLGCFSLTEKFAGVQSGLIVETTATYDENEKVFVLNTPHEGARKNWISQGFVADKTVVLADLVVKGKSLGPHAFVMDFRQGGVLVPGVTVADMGEKTVGNDLDNAQISFDHVKLPRSALLSKNADVSPQGHYELKETSAAASTGKVAPFVMIGQRLYTGRVCVAQAALEYRKTLFARVKAHSDAKVTYGGAGGSARALSEIPQLRTLYEENAARCGEIEAFVTSCESALSESLKSGLVPSETLADAIAVAKVVAVEDSIAWCHRLKQEVGSIALMADSGFKHLDFLQCCKFAEGDSRILMQKLARDRFKRFQAEHKSLRQSGGGGGGGQTPQAPHEDSEATVVSLEEMGAEEAACAALAKGIESHQGACTKAEAWDAEWKNVYKLAEAVMGRIQRDDIRK